MRPRGWSPFCNVLWLDGAESSRMGSVGGGGGFGLVVCMGERRYIGVGPSSGVVVAVSRSGNGTDNRGGGSSDAVGVGATEGLGNCRLAAGDRKLIDSDFTSLIAGDNQGDVPCINSTNRLIDAVSLTIVSFSMSMEASYVYSQWSRIPLNRRRNSSAVLDM